jgi:hypothetical protein
MIVPPGEADDLDLAFRDTLRGDAAPQCDSSRIWSILRGRITAGGQAACLNLPDRGVPYVWPARYYLLPLVPLVS